MEYLLFSHKTTCKKVKLDNLLVGLHEIADEGRLVYDFPYFCGLHLAGAFDVDWSADFINTHVTLRMVLLKLLCYLARNNFFAHDSINLVIVPILHILRKHFANFYHLKFSSAAETD